MKKANFGCAVLAASAIFALGSAFTASAAEWQAVGDEWVYVQNNGEYLKDDWKQDGDKYYYLGSDGFMVRSTLIDDNDNYYYVNSAGIMVTNEWKLIQNPSWQGDDLVDEGSWYYFGSNGRAIRSDGNKAKVYEVGGKKYVFDSYGRMMTGWVTENGEYVEEEDDWPNGMYYADGEGDGSIVTNAWVYISVPDDDNEDDNEPTYHFYFGSNGKKTVSTDKTIGNKKYLFDERGVALYDWQQTEDGNWRYYGDSEEPNLRTGWFQATPDEEMDKSGYDDGEVNWYYASSNGNIVQGEFKTIDSKTYAFYDTGKLITGLKVVTTEDKTVLGVQDVDYISDIENLGEGTNVFYFADNGAVKTGTQNLSIDGSSYTFDFMSSGTPKGAGRTGMNSGYIYDHGRRLAAEDDAKYGVVEYDGAQYVVNESGSIQKNKKNIKDADGYYYCTDKNGVLLHDPLSDKCTEKH